MVPEFKSNFDFSYGPYPILGEFGSFVIKSIHNKPLSKKCFEFLNDSLSKGGHETKEVMVVQIFSIISENNFLIDQFRKNLSGNALITFNEVFKK